MKLMKVWDAMFRYGYAISRESWMTFGADGIVRCNRGFYKAQGKIVEAKMAIVNGEIKSVEVLAIWDVFGRALFGWEINSSDWVVFGKMEGVK